MEEWRSGEEHERAVTLYEAYAVLAAEVGRLRAHRALPATAMHPNPLHAGLRAVAYHAHGLLGRGHDQDAINRRGYLLQMGKTAPVFQFSCGWIYRDDVIAALRHLAKDYATKILRIARQPNKCDAPLRQEIPNIIQSGGHGNKPPAQKLD